jgi:hypothetical protein
MRFRTALLASAIAAGCAGQLNGPTAFKPAYFSSVSGVPGAVPACSGPIRVMVVDMRPEPYRAGRRFEEDRPGVEYPISLTTEAASYVGKALESALRRAGSPGAGPTPSTLAITLTQLNIEEKTYHNAEYAGSVGMEVAFHFADAAVPCWKGRAAGAGKNYGKAASQINYQETLNRALDTAMSNLLTDNGLQDALCGKCAMR